MTKPTTPPKKRTRMFNTVWVSLSLERQDKSGKKLDSIGRAADAGFDGALTADEDVIVAAIEKKARELVRTMLAKVKGG